MNVEYNYGILKSMFEYELQNFKKEKELLQNNFEEIWQEISNIDFKNASVEITQELSIKIILTFLSENVLMITKPKFENEIGKVIFTFFENRKLVLSGAVKIKNLVEQFNKHLKRNDTKN